MARSGYDERTPPGDSAAKVSGQRARQGQNIRGMVGVLAIGIALVVLAYMIMLALSSQPVTGDNRPIAEPASPSATETTVPPQ